MTTQEITSNIDPATFTEKFIHQTSRNVFLTGKAGTGKTTLLRKIVEHTYKNTVIVAPTGIAALNAGGVTIHSFFQLPFGAFIPEFGVQPSYINGLKIETKESLGKHFNLNKQRKKIICNLELLIIDEVSMLRADLLDAMDWCLRTIRQINEPFGGIQVLFIGDMLQLPPVVKNEEWTVLQNYYKGLFFFNARVFEQEAPLYIELEKIYRQSDVDFIRVLNHFRNNCIDTQDIDLLNRYVQPDFDATKNKGYITLTTHNQKANDMNQVALNALDSEPKRFFAEVTGEYPEHLYPLDLELVLKIGAQVIFIKNDASPEKRYYNGKMGFVSYLDEESIKVHFPEENKTIEVNTFDWENIRYTVDEKSNEIKEEVLGTFVHYPLKLAWAITIHKSQGLSFDKAILDIASVFAPGQAYVALSRLRSIDGLVLLKPIPQIGMQCHEQIVQFSQNKNDEKSLLKQLHNNTKLFLHQSVNRAFDFYDLSTKYSSHLSSYQNLSAKSEKIKHLKWMIHQEQQIQNCQDASRKFLRQVDSIFKESEIRLDFLYERIDAAYDYFFKIMELVLVSNLQKIMDLGLVKKSKQHIDELIVLDEELTAVILKMKRLKKIIGLLRNDEIISKDKVWDEDLLNYKTRIIQRLKNQKNSMVNLLNQEEEKEELEILANKKTTTRKVSTYEQTLLLYRKGLSVQTIASNRQMSSRTIHGHLAYLVRNGSLDIKEVMDLSQIEFLKQHFKDKEIDQLSSAKEILGEQVSWEELKYFQAYQRRDS